MQKITPFIWFNDAAEEAANYYVTIFKNSKIESISRYGEGGPGPAGAAMVVNFVLEGQEFMALNGFAASEAPGALPPQGAIALYVDCATQDEVDVLWEKLCDGGTERQCGWVTDKFGVTWNVVPAGLRDVLHGDDDEGSQRAMAEMLKMNKLDINALRKAYDGVAVSP
jgi:predicted 3-demethylubiquinone-9 3-methyltransferase (glyoxalase superfamily)